MSNTIRNDGILYINNAKEEQSKSVDLNLSSGNQTVSPDEDKVLSSVVINKPSTLLSENILNGVSIAGVDGNIVVKEEQEKTVDLDLLSGNQTVSPDSGKTLSLVTINKPSTLLPTNIKKDVSIAGVTGTYESSGGSPSSSSIDEIDNIIFVDYDGEIILSTNVANLPLTELPTPPSHDGLTFDGWNWTLEAINALTAGMVVGALYKTTNGRTRIKRTLTLINGLSVSIKVYKSTTDEMIIHWGDATTDSSSSSGYVTFTHTYSSYGDIVEEIECAYSYYIGGGSSNRLSVSDNYDITEVNLSEYVTSIEPSGFYNNYVIEYISVPSSLVINTSAGYHFQNCWKLKMFSFTTASISSYFYTSIFYFCYSLIYISFPYYSRTNNFQFQQGNQFDGCYSLKLLTFPAYMEKFASSKLNTSGTFRNTYSLKYVVFHFTGSVELGGEAFYSSGITKIKSLGGLSLYFGYVFSYCRTLEKIEYSTHITLTTSTGSLGGYNFQYCYKLTSIEFNSSLTTIPAYLFSNCYNLKEFNVSSSVTTINSASFNACYTLKKINMLGNITSISSQAFYNCYNIIEYDFTNCTSIPTLSSTNVFTGINKLCKIKVPSSLYDDWIISTNWSTYAAYIVAV